MADTLDTGAARTIMADTPAPRAAWSKSRWLLVVIAFVSLSCWRFPQLPLNLRDVDASYQAVLTYAHKTGMQFGQDAVCSYGPLGYLSNQYFIPYAPVARLSFEVMFGLVIATGLCLLAWRIAWPWRLALLGFFILVASPLHWNGDALYADLGIFSWGLLCFLESGPRLRAYVLALVGLAVLGGLVKFTFLILGVFTIGLVACNLVLRGNRRLAAGMFIGYIVGLLVIWCLLGQDLLSLGRYLANSFDVAQGYNETVGVSDVNTLWVLLIVGGAAAAIMGRAITFPIPDREPHRLWRIPLLFWLAGFLFEEWKYACVRSDWLHMAAMFGIVPIMAMAMESLPTSGKRAMQFTRAGYIVCLVAGMLYIQSTSGLLAPLECIRLAGKNLAESLDTVVRPVHYYRQHTEAFHAEQHKYQLPHIRAEVADSTADVFGQCQVYAIFNELNFWPRPVCQSYAAYTRRMMELNEQFYSSSNAPEYVLFDLRAIDNRFPPLEDALLLRHLLLNYQPVLSEGEYLLLRQGPARHVPLTLVREGKARLGEKVNLPDDQKGLLWLEIELQPTAFDKLRAFLYRPGETQLVIWKQSDREPSLKYNAPAAMLSAGFLISPLALDNQDFANIYTGAHPVRAGAFTLEAATELLNLGASSFQYRIFQFER